MVWVDMKVHGLYRLIGRYCKIVMREPGDKKAHTVTGTIQEIDEQADFLIVQSVNRFWYLHINEILAIKPKK